MSEHALVISNLTKSFLKNIVVDNISLSVGKGEFFGFLGPNGAGKTTTINCVTGISTFNSGIIKVFDIDVVNDYRLARTMVGLSSQEFNVEFFGRVREILDYVAGYYGLPKKVRQERILALAEQFNLQDHLQKRFNQLSGGLKRRVVLARAMVHNPELLILDEPTAGVDVELRHELWGHLRLLNQQGKTIILTSHYLEEVELLCDRIAIINKGKIAFCGPKAEYTKNGKKLEDHYLKITKGEIW